MKLWVLTAIVAAAPSLFLLTFFYLKDRYEREPLQHIIMAFGLGLYALIAAVYHWEEFDEPLDGVVYGVAVALGFATLENFLFVARLGLRVAWMRALFAVPAHALFGATMGYYAGRAKFDKGGKLWRDRAFCLLAPAVFHGCYDYALRRGMGAHVWVVITLLSAALWVFVLRRVHRAQHASPFRPGRGA